MGDLTDTLTKGVMDYLNMKYLSAQSSPTEQQVVDRLNDSRRNIIENLRPKRSKAGEQTVGRLDKLVKIIQRFNDDEASGGISFVSLGTSRIHFISVCIGTSETELYPAVEVSMNEIQDRSAGNYQPAANEPVYAYGDGKIYYLPTSHNYITYSYILMPYPMSVGVIEDWYIADDLMPLAIHRTAGYFHLAKKNLAKAKRHLDFYQRMIKFYVGDLNLLIEDWVY